MSTNGKPSPVMSVAVVKHIAYIKIPGRANFASSVDFKTLVQELRGRGCTHFALDLRDCVTMDSTFLGVLAGLALRNADGKETTEKGGRLELELINPNPRVSDLLENLGVVHLFKVVNQETPCTLLFEPIAADHPTPTKQEISENCLAAHRVLMDLNPENIPKFKEVTQFLAEDLRRMKEQG